MRGAGGIGTMPVLLSASRRTTTEHLHRMALSHARTLLPELIDRRRRAGRMLVALDFDGTLAPIVPRPADARLLDGLDEPLRRLAGRTDTTVAIVSGRGLADARSRVGLEGVYYAGNHGFEIEGPGVDRVLPEAREARPALDACVAGLSRDLDDEPGVEIEDKEWTLSVHFRRVTESGAEERIARAVREHCERDGLRVTSGKKVFEVRPDLDWDKGRATEFLLSELGAEGLPAIFIGDDRTDEDAFEVVRELGGGIVVGDPPPADTAAVAWAASPDEVAALIRELADAD